MRRVPLVCASIVMGLLAVPASAWQTRVRAVPGSGRAVAIATDAAGNAIAGGFVDGDGSGPDFIVVKLAATNGAEMWRRVLGGPGGFDLANAVAVDGAQDVFAAGVTSAAGTDTRNMQFTVVKLAGATGAVLWRQDITAGVGAAYGLAVDSVGDAVAVGSLFGSLLSTAFVVVKLAGTSGTEMWRATFVPGGSITAARVITLAPSDDVVAAASGWYSGELVVKLAGSTGLERWHADLPAGSRGTSPLWIGADARQDVVTAGTQNSSGGQLGYVAKLSGQDGSLLWQDEMDQGQPVGVPGLAIRPSGDVVVEVDEGNPRRSSVRELAAADGSVVWSQTLADEGKGLVVDAVGDPIAVGRMTENRSTGEFLRLDFTAAKLDGDGGGWSGTERTAATPCLETSTPARSPSRAARAWPRDMSWSPGAMTLYRRPSACSNSPGRTARRTPVATDRGTRANAATMATSPTATAVRRTARWQRRTECSAMTRTPARPATPAATVPAEGRLSLASRVGAALPTRAAASYWATAGAPQRRNGRSWTWRSGERSGGTCCAGDGAAARRPRGPTSAIHAGPPTTRFASTISTVTSCSCVRLLLPGNDAPAATRAGRRPDGDSCIGAPGSSRTACPPSP